MPPKKDAAKKGKRPAKEIEAEQDEPKSKKAKKEELSDSEESSENSGDEEEDVDFSGEGTSTGKSGSSWNLKLSSWNVNGLRAWLKTGSNSYVKKDDPDVFCLQEIKCQEETIPKEVQFPGYHCYWSYAETKGYSGVGLCSKTKPLNVSYGLGIEKHDNEGRVITAEFKDLYVVTSYVPNSGRGLPRLGYRQEWDKDFRDYLKSLDKKKPVVLCGDLNVAHKPIDLKNPQSNKKTAGFTKEEREGFTDLLGEGFVDSFRHFYPDKKEQYTFWSYLRNARANNTGWRLDYFVVSERLVPKMSDSLIRKDVKGSDHCPVVLLLAQ